MKTAMTGQRIPLRSKIESALAIYRAHRDRDFSNAAGTVAHHREWLGYLNSYVGIAARDASILDLGCGQTATQTALFHADGASVVGIDIELPTCRMNPATFLRVLRLNGAERAMKSLARHVLFDKRFFAELSVEYGKQIRFDEIDTRVMDATRMDFPDSSFDAVYSMAVFEHVSDVDGAVRELNRVLRPGGIAVITIHLFPSLSGGHNLEWLWPDQKASETVAPWDHLRENRHPVSAYLNRLRIGDYRRIFRAEMEVEHEQVVQEGGRLLTPTLESELGAKGFTPEDLLSRTITMFARKKPASVGSSVAAEAVAA